MFFKFFADQKNDKAKFDIIPKTNEEYISVTYGCFRSIHSYRFLSSGLDSLVRTLIDNNHKTLEILKKEIVDKDEKLKIVNEIGQGDRTIEHSKKDYPNGIEKVEEDSFNYNGENDLKLLKTEFPDKRKKLFKKLAFQYEDFNSIDDYQRRVDNLKKEYFFRKVKK